MPAPQVPYAPPRLPQVLALAALEAELTLLQARRSVRRFAGDAVPRALIEQERRINLSNRDFAAVTAAVERAFEPNEALRRAIESARTSVRRA